MTDSVITQNIKSIVDSIVDTVVETSSINTLATLLLNLPSNKGGVRHSFMLNFNDMILDCELSSFYGIPSIDYNRYNIVITHTTLLCYDIRYDDHYPYVLYKASVCKENTKPDKLKNIISMLTWSRDMLNYLKYDNITGKLYDTRITENVQKYRDINDLCIEIFGSIVVKKLRTECCVCYEKTDTVSECGHNICLTCASKVKENDDEEVLCPMCREVLYIE